MILPSPQPDDEEDVLQGILFQDPLLGDIDAIHVPLLAGDQEGLGDIAGEYMLC